MPKGALNIAIRLAREAGATILRYVNRIDTIKVSQKDRFDFASEVDRAAEAEILRELRRAFPDHAILAEESGASAGSSRFAWVIDPLDGTSNFLRGFPHWSVSIAQTERGEPVNAVVYDPLRDELFAASKGSGATLNERRIRVAQRASLDGALLGTGFPFRQRDYLPTQLDIVRSFLLEAEDFRRTGSAALDLAYVAAGRLDGFFEIGLKPWDMAAGALLVREAGGQCCDFSGAATFLTTGRIIAANVKLCEAMRGVIARHLTPAPASRDAAPTA